MVACEAERLPDLVQSRRPVQHALLAPRELPLRLQLAREFLRGLLYPTRLFGVHGVAIAQAIDRALTYIVISETTDQLEQQTFAQSRLRNAHAFVDPEGLEHGMHNRHSAHDHVASV